MTVLPSPPPPPPYAGTELQGANMFGAVLANLSFAGGAPGVGIFRSFSHPPAGEDQAFFQCATRRLPPAAA